MVAHLCCQRDSYDTIDEWIRNDLNISAIEIFTDLAKQSAATRGKSDLCRLNIVSKRLIHVCHDLVIRFSCKTYSFFQNNPSDCHM